MYTSLKRALDFVFGVLLLLAMAPIVLVIAVLILLLDGRPVFFIQVRPGLRETPFRLLKFRTMSSYSEFLDGDESRRLTRLGALLRKTSLDELPSLWNIVAGDLSFVGPRPLLMDYLDIYSRRHRRRHSVRPGLTGLAQISGRNALSWKERLDLDVEYVENQTFWLDLRILVYTFAVVISLRGVYQTSGATMPRLSEKFED